MDLFCNYCGVIFTLFHLIILVLTNGSNEIDQPKDNKEIKQSNEFNEVIKSNETNANQTGETILIYRVKNKRNDKREKLARLNRIIQKSTHTWPMGEVPYYLDSESYDPIIALRIRAAMNTIERSSCLVFMGLPDTPRDNGNWLHITNPKQERDCVHKTETGQYGEIVLALGFECMQRRDILHSLLHALGFKDEVSHPQRDQFIRIMWENIQPKYLSLFHLSMEEPPYKRLVEYDTMSIMHFHDRAYSVNGGATIAPQIPGLVINPSEELSQLDMMKLRLAFGHECNKRKVGQLVDTCKNVMSGGSAPSGGSEYSSESEEASDITQSPAETESDYASESDYATESPEVDSSAEI